MLKTSYDYVTIPTEKLAWRVCKKYPKPDLPSTGGTTVTSTSKAWRMEQVQKNDKISRTRPPLPLFKSPTSLPEQFRYRNTYRRAEWWSSLEYAYLSGVCPIGYSPYKQRMIGGFYPAEYALPRPVVPTDIGWALKTRQKLEDQVVQLGETVFEFRETCKLYTEAAHVVTDAWRTYKSVKRFRKWRKLTPKDVATAEVISTLALAPTLGVLHDSIDVLRNRIEEPVYRRVTAVVSETAEETRTEYGGVISGKWKTTQRARFYFELDIDARRIEFGNPLEIAWELVPFSFVIDWFIPIGDWLGSLDALKGVKNTWGTVSQKQVYTGFDNRRSANLGLTDTRQKITKTGRIAASYHKRWVQDSVPIPMPRLWKPTASWKKLMTATSLLVLLRDSH